jgi:Na+-translocating ferredoxin:NAD+ oxidoreductase RnfC subunit
LAGNLPTSKQEIRDRIREAGVVGAGGAGFPTHVKASASADVVIANACECEPLLATDRYVLEARLDEMIGGLLTMMLATGAGRGVIALREGQTDLAGRVREAAEAAAGVEVILVADTYPAGDEHILVYEVTGRVIPEGGIPPDVKVVVSNANTLVNVRRAMEGSPVTHRLISVCGDVENPGVFEVPLGTTVGDVLALTRNSPDMDASAMLLSGIMMGMYCEDLRTPVDKRMGSITVLPRASEIMVRKSLPVDVMIKRAASVCCQCTQCTELCPRHLMGHDITPHKIMRAVSWGRAFVPDLAGALFCSGCGLCGVYVCPMLLSPDRISFMVRAEMAGRGVKQANKPPNTVLPVRAGRLVPHPRIVERTGLAPYERPLAFGGRIEPDSVRIPLSQHVGVPAAARVRQGDGVVRGQLVGEIPEGALGARVHASIDGVVVEVGDLIVVEKR